MGNNTSCAQALRAIGQALEVLNLRAFELLTEGKKYLLRRDTGTPPSSMPVEQSYTPEQIDRLEREGQARRRNPDGMPDPHNLSQMLRVVGSYIDHRGGRMVRVSRQDQSVTIQYETGRGQRIEETLPNPFIYDLSVHVCVQRERRRVPPR